jgi:hypothetical protein
MPTKQPTPPPKFNIRDQVLIQDVRCKVLNRKYTNKGWLYDIESLTFVKGKQTMRLWAVENSLTLASPSPHDPMHFPQKSTTVVNEQGGKQSHLDARFDCIPPVVLRLLAQCLGFGARKYGDENWINIPQRDNLNHAMNHINEWNRGNRDEPHLVNAMARLTFALWQAVDSKDQPDTYLHPDDNQ